MERSQKKEIVQALMDSLTKDVIAKIDSGAIPEDWDGFELRQLLADKAAQEFPIRSMERKRLKEYRNTVIVNNL